MDHQVLRPGPPGSGSRTPAGNARSHVNKDTLETQINELQILPLAPPSPTEESPQTHMMIKRAPTTNMVSQEKQEPSLKDPPPGCEGKKFGKWCVWCVNNPAIERLLPPSAEVPSTCGVLLWEWPDGQQQEAAPSELLELSLVCSSRNSILNVIGEPI